ncbi:MAG: cache domain-containing protein, partial [Campylobacterota bacterium]|nr:cache domain-containing protein [Campylobacterota bacterium]
MKKTSIANKVNKRLLAFVIVLMAIGLVYILYMIDQAKSNVYKNSYDALSTQIKTKQMVKGKITIVGSIAIANDHDLVKALETNKRDEVIADLKRLQLSYKNNSPFKNVKLHVHTKDIKSFVRSWKPEKFGDDLSSFRETIVKTKETQKSLYGLEVGRAGLVMRGISPIFNDNKEYVGSIEMIQGMNSVVKSLEKEKTELLILMDEKFKRGDALTDQLKIQNYYISQSTISKHYVDAVKKIDLNELKEIKFTENGEHFFVSSPIIDFNGNVVGMYVLAKHLKDISGAIESTKGLVIGMSIMTIIIVLVMMLLVDRILKNTLVKELKIFNKSLDDFLDFVSFKSNKYTPTVVESYDELGLLIHRLNNIAREQDKQLKDDMKVMGEIVITTDKVEQGIYKCRVNAKTGNPMIQTLANTINKMVDVTEKNMNELRSVLKSYTTNDFKPLIDIDPMLKEDLLK